MKETVQHTYASRIAQFKRQKSKYARTVSYISILRLLLFLLFAWFVYQSIAARFEGHFMLFAFLALACLLAAVVVSSTVKRKMLFMEKLVQVNENEIGIADGRTSFLANGDEFLPSDGFATDLNVFGRFSLFHLLNRSASQPGKKLLALHLSKPFTDGSRIREYQSCVRELSQLVAFRQFLLANALLLDEKEGPEQLQKGIEREQFKTLTNGFWSVMSIAWPLLSVTAGIFGFFTGHWTLLLMAMIAGLLLLSGIFKKINLLYLHISKRSYLYTQYARCFRLIGEQAFVDPYLIRRQEEIREASRAFKKLARITGLFDLRLSMFSIFINGLLLYDLFCARLYLRWSNTYQPQVRHWFATLGEFELLNSLATFHFNHPEFVFPQAVADGLMIEATSMGHPLMRSSAAITNDVSIGKEARLYLVTGSNMSGKSTFLRTLGLNMILAQSGAPVFASSLVFCPVRLLTSFHHIDSLEESTSYFYAELKSLQHIVQSLPGPVPALVLLDEVMRGTNSGDKHDGTALLINRLLQYHCLALIATHDTELGGLAKTHPGLIENYCFESEIVDGELHFDFTMRKGISQTKNATFLMKKMGIV